MAINHWPKQERPREKLLLHGARSLSDAELLAIFLRTGMAGKSAVDLARDLLNSFNGLRAVLEADQTQFCSQPGLGPAKYAQLQAVLEMARRHLAEELIKGDALNNPKITRKFLLATLRSCNQEVFACLYLDSQNRLIEFREHFYGTIDSASVYPRELVRSAIKNNASGIILAHNHPSGVVKPSEADLSITQIISSAMQLIDIKLLDHMIVGEGEIFSFAEQGLI